ncbi:MAG TPA: DUF1559 domain-containing protein [Lacipirellulaceae bacterium]|nr:DUF1559 domain-containing protein [Lacipirellulaceae bacterium]
MTLTGRARTFRYQFLCVLLAALMAWSPRALYAQQSPSLKPIDKTFALPGACLVVSLRPGQALQSPLLSLAPIEVLQAAVIQQFGVDPLTAEHLLLTASPPSAGPPTAALHARFSAPLTLRLPELPYELADGKFADMRYLHAVGDPNLPGLLFPDDSSLVVLNDFALPALFDEGRAAPGPLLEKFIAAEAGDDLLAMLDIEPLRPFINIAMLQAPIPPELAEFVQAPNLIKTLEFRLNVSHVAPSELIIAANSDADADRLLAMFAKAKQIVAAQAREASEEALASDDPVEQAGGRYSQRMIAHWNQVLEPGRERERIIVFRAQPGEGTGNQLAAVAIVGFLVALLLPAVQAAREAARRNASHNNLRQIMLALLNYESAHGRFPPHASYSANRHEPLLSWRGHILPYLELDALYRQFRLDEPWDSEHNIALLPQIPEGFIDPSSPGPAEAYASNYLGVQGPNSLFDGTATGRRIASITDGTSNSLAVVQVDDHNAVPWTKPEDWEMDLENPLAGIGMIHPGVFLAAFCDGSVSAISFDVGPDALRAMTTVDENDHELLER